MSSKPDAEVTIRDDLSENAYVIEVDGERAGKAEYRIHEGRVVFTHTEVDDAFSGRGLGSRLAKFALENVRRKDMKIVAWCPFIAAYVKRHEEYLDMVYSG